MQLFIVHFPGIKVINFKFLLNTKNLYFLVQQDPSYKNIPTIVDPKKQNFLSYKNCTLFKPNLKEIKDGLNITDDINDFNEIEKTTSKLRDIISAKAILLTLSNKGIFLNSNNGSKLTESTTTNVIDVSGAGDTVVSVAAMCLACNIDFDELAILANIAGGIVCEKVGVVPISNQELLDRAKKLLNVQSSKTLSI